MSLGPLRVSVQITIGSPASPTTAGLVCSPFSPVEMGAFLIEPDATLRAAAAVRAAGFLATTPGRPATIDSVTRTGPLVPKSIGLEGRLAASSARAIPADWKVTSTKAANTTAGATDNLGEIDIRGTSSMGWKARSETAREPTRPPGWLAGTPLKSSKGEGLRNSGPPGPCKSTVNLARAGATGPDRALHERVECVSPHVPLDRALGAIRARAVLRNAAP